MAKIIEAGGAEITDTATMEQRLAALGIELRHWPTPSDAASVALLEKPALSNEEKDALLTAVDHRFEELKAEHGYTTRDMIVLHDGIPGLSEVLAKFEKIHYHSDDEVRYILAGKGYFGFVEADGGQFLLEVSAGDYLNVPANAEHWFVMRDSKRVKAVRYFIDTEGWTPVYTDRAVAFN